VQVKILVIGGTRFVGRQIAERALENGHEVTLFNRGETNAGVFPQAEKLTGDRDGKLDALLGRTWDCVIDTCGYFPRVVKQSIDLLKDAVGQYIFISSVSVYNEEGKATLREDSELRTIEDETIEEINEETYGALKVLCENAVIDAYKEKSLIIRPGLIVGPHDYTDRFFYWVRRIQQGGRMLVPDLPDQPVQFIDGRDLAAFTIALAEKKQSGIYNAVGPEYEMSFGEYLDRCQEICGCEIEYERVSDNFLKDQDDLTPFRDIPMWMSEAEKPYGMMRADNTKAIAAGLTFLPFETIVSDMLKWEETRSDEDKYLCGLRPEKENELLALWDKEKQI
jgi:2'-hydroxyisoflavone reductase